jgi:hypothetical protein
VDGDVLVGVDCVDDGGEVEVSNVGGKSGDRSSTV